MKEQSPAPVPGTKGETARATDPSRSAGVLSPAGELTDEERTALVASHGGQQGTTLALSYSRLSRYQKCPKAFQLQFLEHAEVEPSGAAVAGSAVHQVIEEMIIDGWYRRADMVADEGKSRFLNTFDELLKAEGATWSEIELPGMTYPIVEGVRWAGRKRILRNEEGKEIKDAEGNKLKIGEDYRWMQQMGPLWIKRAGTILRRDRDHGLFVIEANVERKVSAWLDGPGSTLITGVIDVTLLGTVGNEPMAVIRDWKTGTWTEPLQMANYAWLLANIDDPNARILTNIGQIAYLRGTTEDSWIKEYDLEAWTPLIPLMYRDALSGINAEQFPMQPSNMCGSCWVRAACPYGKTLDA